ncbi:membrane-bound serine protease (ClpP class) [Acetoanaerobium pronyense]|uniref:Membrane-bound serine protease (ClpP class) n=1 Tax=Acetoanaerobium pronyense TaxID=1482736 RepID=A0ABS4KEY8_9FIRM|nr:NfeD family protein [Acetoanaerobium pronyense]MBP2026337.1 membrane-bound serine protease (ClpP class) [Acetoanaerobium pronyense]
MKKIIITFLFIMFLLQGNAFAANETIYVISLDSEVNAGMLNYLKHGINDAENNNADLILIQIDTLGGRIDSAEAISREILGTRVRTASFVNTKAESAGVLLSISADDFYMAPASTIGSAEPIPNSEKTLSYWRSLLETTAERTGRDPQLVAAMADSSISIDGVVDEGRLLNLTTNRAMELEFIDGIANNRADVYASLGYENVNEVIVSKRTSDNIIGFISSAVVSQILLTAAFIGIVIEVITPGLGIGGLIGIVGFALFFAGSILSGSTTTFAVLIFLLGIVLLTIEVFIPGFGVFGIGGIIAIFGSIVMASSSAAQAILSISIALVITTIVIALIIKYIPKRNLSKTLFLDTNLDKEGGFVSSKEVIELIGREGKSLTYLRPSGKIEIDGQIYDATTNGMYISKDTKVIVLNSVGSRLIVKEKEGV